MRIFMLFVHKVAQLVGELKCHEPGRDNTSVDESNFLISLLRRITEYQLPFFDLVIAISSLQLGDFL